jgi:hypothetical protein
LALNTVREPVGVGDVLEEAERGLRGGVWHAEPAERGGAVHAPATAGDGPGEAADVRRLRGRRHRALRPAPADEALLRRSRIGRDQVEDLVDERRARQGGAVLVARLPAQIEALRRSRDAGVEQVALLLRLLDPAQVGIAELPAPLLGEQRVRRPGARELAVLKRGAEECARPGDPGSQGAEDPDPAGGRAAPGRHRRGAKRLERHLEARLLASGERAHRQQLLQELRGRDARA